ncbi:MAG: F0F1 ATP synthase subunit B [Planctomycetota bacterium]
MVDRLFLSLLVAAALCLAPVGVAFADEAEASSAEASEESAVEADAEDAAADHAEDGHEQAGHDDDVHGDDGQGHDGHGGEHAKAGSPDPLETDLDLAVWTGVVFLFMLAVLSQIAWKPIMDGLAAREDSIAGNLAAADSKHEEAKALLADHQAKLAGAADEVRGLLEEARRDADSTIAQAKEEAKAVADTERERAIRDIEQAKDVAVRQLAERTAGLAIDLAGKVVRQDITAERQSEIVRDALGRFADSDPSSN